MGMTLAAFVLTATLALAQTKTVTGTVVDDFGEPVIGANVLVKGTSNGTVTDIDGKFSLNVDENATIEVSFIGYNSQTISVAGQKTVKVVLSEDSQQLDDVVVVGYGVVKKSDLTGAVGSVKADNIVAKGATSVMESLQGQVAGVNISQASSRAGEGFNIAIRGKSTMGDATNPLYVIDGIVTDNMDFLNPSDIEKIDILKDASSTAIYGSRATNGVVMITTKNGAGVEKGSRTSISYDGYYGIKQVANMPDFMDGDEWSRYRFARYTTLKSVDKATGLVEMQMKASDLQGFWCYSNVDNNIIKDMYLNKGYTDWADLMTSTGHQQNHFINVSGATKSTSFHLGVGYQDEKGVMQDKYQRYNAKISIDHTINSKVSVGMNANYAAAKKDYGSKNAVQTGFRMAPWAQAYYKEDAYDKVDGKDHMAGELILQPMKTSTMFADKGGPTSTLNPLVDAQNSSDITKTHNILANFYIQYKPIEDVILKTTFSPQYSTSRRGEFYGVKTDNMYSAGVNESSITYKENFNWTWDTQANYMHTWGDHSLNALALFSMFGDRTEGDDITVRDMPFDVNYYNTGSASSVQDKNSYYQKMTMMSWVVRLNYNYKQRYLLTVSSRWDGSSKFGKDDRWGMFPSAALAWRINAEPWMAKTENWLSNLKLRVSYGVTGNNAGVGPYQTSAIANNKYYYSYGANSAIGYWNDLINADLTWEKTKEFNLGLDFGFLNNRITGSVDYYHKVSSDLLMEQKTSIELGSPSGAIMNNVGKVLNTGVEASLTTTNIQTKNWTWTTTFSFARNRNSIQELNGGKEDIVGSKWFIGHPIDVVYDYEYAGVCTDSPEDQAYAAKYGVYEGEMKVVDQNNDGKINEKDRKILGHNAPTWTGSFTSNLYAYGWDLSISLYTQQGGYVKSPFMAEFVNYKDRGRAKLNFDYYIPAGTPILNADGSVGVQEHTHYGEYPYPYNGSTRGYGGGAGYWGLDNQNTYTSNWYVKNDFVRIKNITLGYTFPSKWMKAANISSLRVYLNVINPFTFTDYKGFDPEWADVSIANGAGGVSSRTWQFGINLKF